MTTATQEPVVPEFSTVSDVMIGAPLTAQDRCDRCGAQAYVRVTMASSGYDFLACAHHFREGETKLRTLASHIHDERETLENEEAALRTASHSA